MHLQELFCSSKWTSIEQVCFEQQDVTQDVSLGAVSMFAAMERAVVHKYSVCSKNERVNFVFKPPIVTCPSRSRAFYCILVHISFPYVFVFVFFFSILDFFPAVGC